MKSTSMKVHTKTTDAKKATKTTAMKQDDGQDVMKRVCQVQKQLDELQKLGDVLFALQDRLCNLEKQAEELDKAVFQLRAQFLGRARQTQKQPVPPPRHLQFPWEMHYSLDYNVPYFWNSVTGLAVWERPV